MKKYYLLSLAFSTILFSCHIENKGVKGCWSVEQLEFRSEPVVMMVNMLIFENTECTSPHLWDDEASKFGVLHNTQKGTWKFINTEKGNYILKIDSKNELFSGNYRVRFFHDQTNALKMELSNGDLKMICGKWLTDYKVHKDFMDELEERTN